MSDDRHNRHLLKAKQEELQAKKAAVKFLGDSDQATMEVRDLRERSRAPLERPEVRAMVDALAGAVLKRETSSGDEALYVML